MALQQELLGVKNSHLEVLGQKLRIFATAAGMIVFACATKQRRPENVPKPHPISSRRYMLDAGQKKQALAEPRLNLT